MEYRDSVLTSPEAGLRRVTVTTTDPDEAHEHLRETYADHSVRMSGDVGQFRFRHDITDGGSFSVAHYQHSLTCHVETDPLGDLIVGQVIGGRMRIETATAEIRPARGEVFLLDPQLPMTVEWENLQAGLVRLDRSVVDRVAAEVSGDAAGVRFGLARAISTDRARHWQGLVRYLHHELLVNATAYDSPLIRTHAVRLLAAAVLETFPYRSGFGGPEPSGGVGGSAVRRAVSYIDEHADQAIGITDIADAARLGPRSLQDGFRRHLGTTPMAHLRTVRLERVHRDLMAVDPEGGTTVAGVARRWGFAHHGRFAALYRERYGHPPSRTIRG